MIKDNQFNTFFSSEFLEPNTFVQLSFELNNTVQKLLNSHILISLTDASGVILYANEKFCDISGYKQSELIGQTHRIVRSNHHNSEFIATIWQTIKRGKTWIGQFCNRKKNGGIYWVDCTIVPLLGENGEPEKYLSICHNIVENERLIFLNKQLELPLSKNQGALQGRTSTVDETKSAIWDEAATLEQLEGDQELLKELINLFLEKAPLLLVEMKDSEAKQDLDALAESARVLRGMVNHLVTKKLVKKIIVLESAASENKVANFKIMTEVVIDLTTQLIDVLSKRK